MHHAVQLHLKLQHQAPPLHRREPKASPVRHSERTRTDSAIGDFARADNEVLAPAEAAPR
jgi:hypothetical protein